MNISTLPIYDRVTRSHVDALLRGEALAIWIKELIPADHCEHVYERVRATSMKPPAQSQAGRRCRARRWCWAGC